MALDHGVSKEGMALAELWKHAIGKGKESELMIINVLEDNESACRIVVTGNNPNMRYMSRTQRIDISWLNEQFNEGIFRFVACPSHDQGGDIFMRRQGGMEPQSPYAGDVSAGIPAGVLGPTHPPFY